MLLLLIELLLFNGGFELVFVFECLSTHAFLTLNALFVCLPTLLTHRLLLLQLLAISVELQLDIILSLSLFHLCIVLDGLTFLLLHNLCLLNLKLLLVFFELELLRLLLLKGNLKSCLRVRTRVQVFSGL